MTAGRATTDRLVFLHGFTQSHHHWHRVATLIAEGRSPAPELTFVDLPGHGLSGDDRDDGIDAIGPRLTALAGPGTYIGYSMGGRVALATAVTAPGAIERLVLIGATAGIDDPAERADRRHRDDELAARIERIGVDAFIDDWLAGPLFTGLPDDRRGDAARRRNTAAGLAHSLRAHGTGTMTPLWSRLGEIDIPVLVLAGERDTKFTELGHRLASGIPHAELDTIAGAGHAAHAERPEATARRIAGWLWG